MLLGNDTIRLLGRRLGEAERINKNKKKDGFCLAFK